MLRDITSSFKELVASLPWMDLETKEATWKKASAIKSYIGYPKWLLEDGELEKFYKHVSQIFKLIKFYTWLEYLNNSLINEFPIGANKRWSVS